MTNALQNPSSGILQAGSVDYQPILDPAPVQNISVTLSKKMNGDQFIATITTAGLNSIGRAAIRLYEKEKSHPLGAETKSHLKLHLRFIKRAHNGSNNVYIVDVKTNLDGKYPIRCYLKFPKFESEASATLERLMWKISKIMGFKDYFVPTKVVKIALKEGSGVAFATMQPYLVGKTLYEYTKADVKDVTQIKTHHLALAVLASIVFGMFDAHSKNIMITGKGRIRFIDNAQSLPNSNAFIAWGSLSNIRSSYRCSLLDLPDSYLPVSDDAVKALIDKVMKCQDGLSQLSDYLSLNFNEGSTKAKSLKLPEHWLEIESVLCAMKERLDLASKTLSTLTDITLAELAARSNPRYLLAFGIYFMVFLTDPANKDEHIDDQLMRSRYIHSNISTSLTSSQLVTLVERGYDISRLIALSEEAPNLSTFIEQLKNEALELEKDKHETAIPKHIKEIEAIRTGIRLDLKEISPKHLECAKIIKYNSEILNQMGVPVVLLPKGSHEYYDIPYKEFILWDLGTIYIAFAFRSKFGLIIRQCMIHEKYGYTSFMHPKNGVTSVAITKEGINQLIQSDFNRYSLPCTPPKNHNLNLFREGNQIQLTFQNNLLSIHNKKSDGAIGIQELTYLPELRKFNHNGTENLSFDEVLSLLDKQYPNIN